MVLRSWYPPIEIVVLGSHHRDGIVVIHADHPVALAGTGWLARRGAAGAPLGADPAGWSLPLRIAVAGCALASLVGLIQIVVTAFIHEPYPFRGALWGVTLVIWALHGACLAGLLLRRAWSRRFAAILSFGWSALMGWQIADHLWYGRPVDPLDFSIAMTIVVVTAGFGALLLRTPGATDPHPAP